MADDPSPEEKVVLHAKDKRLVKGSLRNFSQDSDTLTVVPDDPAQKPQEYPVDDFKSIFYVKSFEGNKDYKEQKRFGLMASKGRKVIVKFYDGEIITGFVDHDVPWQKGFFLSTLGPNQKGFYLYPSDPNSNNVRIFIVASSVVEVQRF